MNWFAPKIKKIKRVIFSIVGNDLHVCVFRGTQLIIIDQITLESISLASSFDYLDCIYFYSTPGPGLFFTFTLFTLFHF